MCSSSARRIVPAAAGRLAGFGGRSAGIAQSILIGLPTLPPAIPGTIARPLLWPVADIVPVTAVDVDIGISVNVDVDIAATPVAVVPMGNGRPPKHSHPESHQWSIRIIAITIVGIAVGISRRRIIDRGW